ncbi:MAG: acyl-CoA dehydrogenase family protein [Candidatus Marinimicrobia bacterium]|nr:acyl-CoA dehydrogenase family protein [Candidatus Neomarinimicrobiota bacterium]
MSDNINQIGGKFLVQPVGADPIYCREKFTEEHRDIEQMVKEFGKERIYPNKEKIEKFDKDLSLSLIRETGELGLLGVGIPEEYGGMDLDKITTAIVIESIASGYSSSFLTTFSVQTAIGMLPIAWFGTKEQKEKYLPKLVTGEWIGAYGLTEPSAGSDALSGKTKAVLSDDGKHYILNGEKIFITNGSWADVYTVFAQVDGNKFSAFIVDRDTPGFEVGPEEKKMGIKGSSTTPLTFTDAKVPVENLLYKVGKGATIAFNSLNIGRFKLGAAELGGMKETISYVTNYASERKQFGQSISNFDVIKGKLAQMVIKTYSADSMIYRTIGLIQGEIDKLDKSSESYYLDMGAAMEKFAIESSMTKIYGSESMAYVLDEGIQTMGGYGFVEEYPLATTYRSDRINRIWEGSNEINRQIITGYMMKRALLEELPIRETVGKIDQFLSEESHYNESDALRKEKHAIDTGKQMALYLFHKALSEFGQDLKHEQQLTEILANMFIELYTAGSTISRAEFSIEAGQADSIVLDIARAHTAEVSLTLLNMALTGMNGITRGHLSETMVDYLKKFEARMLLPTDIIGLKRKIANYVYSQKSYPF